MLELCWWQEIFIFSHCGQKCPENTWERTNVSSGWCKTASMTSRRCYWRDVYHRQRRQEFVFWTSKPRKIINHYTPEGTRESKICYIDDSASLVVDCKSWDTRMGFPCPFRSVVIESNNPNRQMWNHWRMLNLLSSLLKVVSSLNVLQKIMLYDIATKWYLKDSRELKISCPNMSSVSWSLLRSWLEWRFHIWHA